MDLKGRRVGMPSTNFDERLGASISGGGGLAPSDIQWVMGGMITPDRPEKIKLQLPPEFDGTRPAGATLNQMADGD